MKGIRQIQKAPVPEQSPRLQPVRVGRRTLLVMAGGGVLAACTGDDSDADPPADASDAPADGTTASAGREAPALAEQVEAGTLPPVDERLPTEPLVVEPNDRLGVYGGDWNTAYVGSAAIFLRSMAYEYLMRWTPDFTEVIPNVARDVEVSADGTQFTLTLREGMRWSDGEPFTADDLMFVYHDVLLNPAIRPVPLPIILSSDGTPAGLEKLDDYSVRFTFSSANGLFLQYLATPEAFDLTQYPRHYLEQFHEDYNPDVQQLVDEEGLPDWVALFRAKLAVFQNPELPRIHPWVPTNVPGEGEQIVFERNPYYWKVDPDGRQLPYLDRVLFHDIQDQQVVVLNASSGDFEMESLYVKEPQFRPVLAANQEDGDYQFFTQVPTSSVSMVLALNLTHGDPVKREIFQNKDFRIGVSHAINRQEIIDTVYQRQGEPYQVAPRPESPYFDEEMAKQYTEYNVDLANDHFAQAGYAELSEDGSRLGPDGNPISFTTLVRADNSVAVDALSLIQAHLSAVGVDMRVEAASAALYGQQRAGATYDAYVWEAEGGGGTLPPLRTDWWFPSSGHNYASAWMEWYQSRGEAGEEPPEEVRTQMEIYNQEVRPALDDQERIDAMSKVLDLSKEIFYHIGISLRAESVGVVKNNFHNVPETMTDGWYYPTPGPANPEQFFIE